MEEKDGVVLELLQHNRGFLHPEKWIEYAIAHNFEKVRAERLKECPDCAARSFDFMGQFCHYSTLIRLQSCTRCGLVFADTRIDPAVIKAHFEEAYKDEEYFSFRRSRIFDQIARIAARMAPRGGSVLDVGGAKGHLLALLKRRRPDLSCVLNDLSVKACRHAKSEYGFRTVCGGIGGLAEASARFDLVILSDVIYYEPELRRLWAVLPRLVSEGGTAIIRVPNKIALIRFWQFMTRVMRSTGYREMCDRVKFFNPEHLYVFSRDYLVRRLKTIGFRKVVARASELPIDHPRDVRHQLFYCFSNVVRLITLGNVIATPSLLIIATGNSSNKMAAASSVIRMGEEEDNGEAGVRIDAASRGGRAANALRLRDADTDDRRPRQRSSVLGGTESRPGAGDAF